MWDAICRARKRVGHWASQHQTLLVGTGVVVACSAGAYYMVRRVVNEAENMTKDIQRQIAEQQRLGVHLRRTEEECKAAFLRFLPSMKTRIYKQLDLEHIVESLKVLDKNEKDTRDMLWDDAKLIGFTRLYASVYAYCSLQVLLHCELLIMGRETFDKAAAHANELDGKEDDIEDAKDTLTRQHQFLSSTMDYFFTTGLPKLIEAVEVHIHGNAELHSWRVHEKRQVQADELHALLGELHVAPQWSVEQWQLFLIFPETPAAIVEPSSASAKPWLNELRDILDRCHHFLHRHLLFMSCMAYMHSPFLLQALQDATNSAFERMTTRLVASLFHIPQKQDVPLAKIIPQLKSEAANLFKPQLQDELWDDLTKRDSLQHLTTSIFAPNAASIPSTWV
ncbi:hypothetical protein H310_09303 [Aphanomyces invadans]|uniref:Uncharacterized protein n=1 Tax=Aphanomyces invadans TaxID=157072 RepID=A0A024TXE2_9STRA|nr:hypothetical protein H310_09303 [Aphanomyces invadans]ETV98002.1 hypothetical protein H310_09303 [Aphanomyces invadans]|eukprot:XP_008873563.1 hypothetical protein H310_09303 [Aphanomyces invadans]